MDTAEAEELGKFRRNLQRCSLAELAPIVASVLDECIEVLRGVVPGSPLSVEMAAALSAELHKRHVEAIPQPSSLVGNA